MSAQQQQQRRRQQQQFLYTTRASPVWFSQQQRSVIGGGGGGGGGTADSVTAAAAAAAADGGCGGGSGSSCQHSAHQQHGLAAFTLAAAAAVHHRRSSRSWRSGTRAAPAFASVSLSMAAAAARQTQRHQQPLFSLAEYSGGGGSSESPLTTDDSDVRQQQGASGYESDDDDDDDSDLQLAMLTALKCAECRHPLAEPPGGARRGPLAWLWPFGRQRQGGKKQRRKVGTAAADALAVCDGCQRAFHSECVKLRQRRGGSGGGGGGNGAGSGATAAGLGSGEDDGGGGVSGRRGAWFHARRCRDVSEGLAAQARRGPTPLPLPLPDGGAGGGGGADDGRTWALVDVAPRGPRDAGGARALRELKASVGDALEVLLQSYGPHAAGQLVDHAGHAVLLRGADGRPLTAGLLDVYGADAAVLDLVATAVDAQGRGHCGAMLRALCAFLGPSLGVGRLLAVVPRGDADMQRLWQHSFGFAPLTRRQQRALAADLPPLEWHGDPKGGGGVLLQKALAPRGSSAAAAAAAALPAKKWLAGGEEEEEKEEEDQQRRRPQQRAAVGQEAAG